MAVELTTSKQSTNNVKCLIYGVSGAGKTPLAATSPNPVIINSDDGLLSVAQQDIPSIRVKTLKDLRKALKIFGHFTRHKRKNSWC